MDVPTSSTSAGSSGGTPTTRSLHTRRKADLSLLRIKSPKDYLNMFREWWHVGVVCGVLVGAIIGFKEIRKPPMYESMAALRFMLRRLGAERILAVLVGRTGQGTWDGLEVGHDWPEHLLLADRRLRHRADLLLHGDRGGQRVGMRQGPLGHSLSVG